MVCLHSNCLPPGGLSQILTVESTEAVATSVLGLSVGSSPLLEMYTGSAMVTLLVCPVSLATGFKVSWSRCHTMLVLSQDPDTSSVSGAEVVEEKEQIHTLRFK